MPNSHIFCSTKRLLKPYPQSLHLFRLRQCLSVRSLMVACTSAVLTHECTRVFRSPSLMFPYERRCWSTRVSLWAVRGETSVMTWTMLGGICLLTEEHFTRWEDGNHVYLHQIISLSKIITHSWQSETFLAESELRWVGNDFFMDVSCNSSVVLLYKKWAHIIILCLDSHWLSERDCVCVCCSSCLIDEVFVLPFFWALKGFAMSFS